MLDFWCCQDGTASRERTVRADEEPAAPPVKKYRLLSKSFDTLDQLYKAVTDAQTRGNKYYWGRELVEVVKDVDNDDVKLKCLLCQSLYTSCNPSESLSNH